MKAIKLIVFLITMSTFCTGQAYVINHFQSSYDTLVGYNSLSLELALAGEDPYVWENNFDFGFRFPFYGDTFNNVYVDSDGYGYFPGSDEFYNFYLFTGSFIIGSILDTPYLNSEVRYIHTIANNLEALVIEYHNIYVFDEDNEDHHINFQIWFYENGVIEVHFGPIDLDNCSRYLPGEGFTHDPDDPESGIYGPWVEINNFDFSRSAYFFGDHTNPNILYDDYENAGVLTSVPPEGFVIQFLPASISATEEIMNERSNNFYVTHQDGTFVITDKSGCFKACEVYDLLGRKLGESNEVEFNLTATLPQIVFLFIKSDCGPEVHKIWMN